VWSHDNYRYVCRSDQQKAPSTLEKIPYVGAVLAAFKLWQASRQSKNKPPITSDSRNNPGNVPMPKVYGFEGDFKAILAQHATLNRMQPHAYPAIKQDAIELRNIYTDYEIGDPVYLENRIRACQEAERECVYATKTYALSNQSIQLLMQAGVPASTYQTFHGNQLQQALHQECIHVIERAAALHPNSPLYDYRPALIDLADSAHAYNRAGAVSHASSILSFCHTLLDYGKAIVEGAILGATAAAQDIIDHPIQAALCIVAGEYVLAYQLSKLAWNVAELGILFIINPEKASAKYDAYMAPLNHLIDAIEKKEITMRDMVKGGAAIAVGWKTQSKMLGGLNKMCKIARAKAIDFAKNNPAFSPTQYMTTPEGFLLKATHKLENPTVLKKEFDTKSINNFPQEMFTQDIIRKSVEWLFRDEKIIHIFGNDNHGFKTLVNIYGNEKNVATAIFNAIAKTGKLPGTGRFEDILVRLDGYDVVVRGVVHDGLIKVGTMYMPAFFTGKL